MSHESITIEELATRIGRDRREVEKLANRGRIPGRKVAGVRVKATSCDLCHDHAEPSCVYACPHDAAHRVNPPEFFAGLLAQPAPKARS